MLQLKIAEAKISEICCIDLCLVKGGKKAKPLHQMVQALYNTVVTILTICVQHTEVGWARMFFIAWVNIGMGELTNISGGGG
jgi:hypothetical protein